jgi:hypothetical protein
VNDAERGSSYRRLMVGRGGKRRRIMHEQAIRMLFATIALSAFAALLASTANARIPEGDGARAVPAQSQQGQQPAARYRWSRTYGVAPRIWATLDPAIQGAIMAGSKQTPLATSAAIPAVDPSTFDGYRG